MRVPGFGRSEEGPKRATVVVRMNYDLWTGMEKSGNPETALRQRAIEELRLKYRYNEHELEVVDSDPTFAASVNSEYVRAADLFKHKRRLPPTLKIHFLAPGTRVREGAN